MPEHSPQSAEVTAAFADLDRARATLAAAETARRDHVNSLRRFAYKHGLTVRQARDRWILDRRDEYTVLIRAEVDYSRALRDFQRRSMIAALTRVIDTDRRLNAAAA